MKKSIISIQKEDKYHNLKKVLVNIITGLRTLGAIAIVPILILYLIFRKEIIKGVASSGIKG